MFRLTDHINRLFDSAKIFMIDVPFSVEEIIEATKATVAVNALDECYIRPIVYLGYGEMGLNPLPCPVQVSIAVWPWGTYLGDEGMTNGVRMKISSWQRHSPNAIPPAAKGTGMYINSSMAKVEALKAGYDEAILLSPQGYVSECTGENLFVVRRGRIITPPISAGALEGITQDSIMTIAPGLRLRDRVRQRPALRSLHGGRGVPHRDGRRGGACPVDRRPDGGRRPPGGHHPEAAGGLRGGGAGPDRPLQGLERICLLRRAT